MSAALNISTCEGDSCSSTTYKHLILGLSRSVESFQADTGTNSNRLSLICAVYGEVFYEGDILQVSGPEEE